ncbi:MAG: VWA domain-containing protein [Rhodobacteraceae bacterium]|nr:VWA domain-containing protein [Paracoccaceae bacterium]
MAIFSLFLIMVMLITGGMAVDLMRLETHRIRLQATLDRAVLAAADLEQTLDPETVVRDYFAKADLLDDLTSVIVTEGLNSRTVNAVATTDVDMIFMRMMGIDTMVAPAAGTAAESVTDIEIIMVLDVSGSMGSNSKLTNLKTAAEDFVATVFSGDSEGRISIGIVPFNGQVNLGAALLAQYNVTDQHGLANSNCVDLPPAAYSGSDISTTLAMPQTAFVDTYSGTSHSSGYVNYSSYPPYWSYGHMVNAWCPPEATNTVFLPSRNQGQLISHINGLYAIGATSINAGMRWGTELLDSGSRPMFTDLISDGEISASFTGRPYDYFTTNTMKVVVLMTDGQHFAEERINDGFRIGLSPIYRGEDGKYSIYHANQSGSNKYYVPHTGGWQNGPWTGGSSGGDWVWNGWQWVWQNGSVGTATQQTWPEVWSDLRLSYVAWQFYARAFGYNSYSRDSVYAATMATIRDQTPTSEMDTQLQAMCTASRNNGIVIFGIAFEAPANGENQIFQCASSPSHFYDASGLEIVSVFQSIANRINSLRLTQ